MKIKIKFGFGKYSILPAEINNECLPIARAVQLLKDV
tara:strand:- start:304 stop:414 length:111 start_codon:yes stop_codon:yes gene_type:complete